LSILFNTIISETIKKGENVKSKNVKPSVGQKLFIIYTQRREVKFIRNAEVVKVGRKYFKVMMPWNQEIEFNIDEWNEKTDYAATYYAFESEQEYQNIIRKNNLWRILEDYFRYNRQADVTLDQLEIVCDTLDFGYKEKLLTLDGNISNPYSPF